MKCPGLRLHALAATLAAACVASLGSLAETPKPAEQPPLSRAGFASLDDFLQSAVRDGRTKAATAVLARGDQVIWQKSAGEMAPGAPMRDDAIMPLASIGKLYTATAAMILADRDRIALDDPVALFISEYAGSGITVRHLLTHTAGLTVNGDAFWNAWNMHAGQTTTLEMAKALAALPRTSPPGERFDYGATGASYEVLAAVIEKASGETLEQFLSENVFKPLGLSETFFYVPAGISDRLPAIWRKTEAGLQIAEARGDQAPRSTYFYGGGGVLASGRDLVRFGRLFLEGGAVDGVRILSPESVREMMSDQLGDKAPPAFSWGFGAAIMKGPAGETAQYGWNGGGYATFWIDPARKLIAYFAMPLTPPGDNALLQEYRRLVHSAMSDKTGPGR
jgi:CubicO group peptidase (beta-lactamase class C family)